jgi:hypothetical protein
MRHSILLRQVLITANVDRVPILGGYVTIHQQPALEGVSFVVGDTMMLPAEPQMVIRLTHSIQ